MRRALIATLIFACSAGRASAADLATEIMAQPGAPIRVVGCSATPQVMRDGSNVVERASFESTGPRTATAVRIGFAFFDVLGGRQIRNGISTGTFTPGARIDLQPFAGHMGEGTRKLVCFAFQASFTDGTSWSAAELPSQNAGGTPPGQSTPSATPLASVAGAIPSEMLQPENGPVRFDRCDFATPRAPVFTKLFALTNTSDKRITSADIAYVLYNSAGKAFVAHSVLKGDFAPGAPFGGQATTSVPERYAKAYCAVGIVEFADGTKWSAGAGFLKRATAP